MTRYVFHFSRLMPSTVWQHFFLTAEVTFLLLFQNIDKIIETLNVERCQTTLNNLKITTTKTTTITKLTWTIITTITIKVWLWNNNSYDKLSNASLRRLTFNNGHKIHKCHTVTKSCFLPAFSKEIEVDKTSLKVEVNCHLTSLHREQTIFSALSKAF